MNRTILFKAKTLIGRELRTGSLIQTGHAIMQRYSQQQNPA